jgi:hypothetical protein
MESEPGNRDGQGRLVGKRQEIDFADEARLGGHLRQRQLSETAISSWRTAIPVVPRLSRAWWWTTRTKAAVGEADIRKLVRDVEERNILSG